MYDAAWNDPVVVDLPQPYGRQTISTTREAAECLMESWPEPDVSSLRDEALRLCLEVFEENEPPETARSAFLAAVRNAGLPTL
jgi:ribosomal 50S subunit-associated protein YjgA (DUF615 family)